MKKEKNKKQEENKTENTKTQKENKENKKEEKQIIIAKQENYIKSLKKDRNEQEHNSKLRKKIIENLIIAIALIVYFSIIFLVYTKIGEDKLLFGMKLFSLIILFFGIVLFEIAYHKDSGNLAINGVEVLLLALYTLSIAHVRTQIEIEFSMYLFYSLSAFAIYYILKTSLICTSEKRRFAHSLTDIHEIVVKEPVKKEAKRKKNKENI